MARRKSLPLTPHQLARIGSMPPGVGTGTGFTGWQPAPTSCRTCARCEGERAGGRVLCGLGRSVRAPDPGCSDWVREAGADARHEVYG